MDLSAGATEGHCGQSAPVNFYAGWGPPATAPMHQTRDPEAHLQRRVIDMFTVSKHRLG